MKIIFFLFLVFNAYIFADYLVEYSHRNDINSSKLYNKYVIAHKKSLKQYKEEISKLWKDVIITNNTKFVQYSNDFKSRTIIDYKKEKIIFEVISKDDKLAHEYILKLFDKLIKLDTKTLYKNDILRKKISNNFNTYEEISIQNTKILENIIDINHKKQIMLKLSLDKYDKYTQDKNTIYTTSINFDTNYKRNTIKKYDIAINKISKKYDIPKKLINAIINNLTRYNLLAQNDNLSYGLMLLSVKNAMKSYNKIYHKDKFINPIYILNENNNIQLATAYLDILFEKFNNIKNLKSRYYCVIVAYKNDIDFVFNIFDKNINNATNKINTLNHAQVYKTMLRKMKNKYDRIYLVKTINDLSS